MVDILYTKGQASDASRIGKLHAESWQRSYRGILSDDYLHSQVITDRINAWEKRMSQDDETRHLLLAEKDNTLIGFVCVFLDYHPEWGALIDNLHVHADAQGYGIGRRLMQEAGQWVAANRPGQPMHLWVYRDNKSARGFYERVQGEAIEQKVEEQPDGNSAHIIRYVWRNPGLIAR